MNTKILSDIPLSPIGLGCYAISGVYGQKDPNQFTKIIKEAFDLGIKFFDTADQYGDAEEVLGKAVKPFRYQIAIASKIGLTNKGSVNLTKKYIISACEASLKRLQTDYLDLYQIHYDDPKTPVSETIEALELLKKEGKIRHYGVGHLPKKRILEYLELGNISTVLMELSAVATKQYQQIHPLQTEYNFGIIGFSTTGRGLLTGKITPGHQFAPNDIRNVDPLFQKAKFASGLRVAEKLKELGKKYGKTPVQVAIAWVLAQPGVVTALIGPSKSEHLRENIGAIGWRLEVEDLQNLNQFLKEEEKKLVRETKQEIYNILKNNLNSDPEQAIKDLIYVIENSIEIELVNSKDVIPLFQQLWKIKKRPDGLQIQPLMQIQKELSKLIK